MASGGTLRALLPLTRPTWGAPCILLLGAAELRLHLEPPLAAALVAGQTARHCRRVWLKSGRTHAAVSFRNEGNNGDAQQGREGGKQNSNRR